jgi:flavin reductase (DIM6/NTAB) family NADH-FMN oxidoreductase RutF
LEKIHLTKHDIANTPRVDRLKLINSITGIKPGNVIGSRSRSGQTNLAVFSSIVHLGSAPALLGFVLRPNTEFRRDTYDNIAETGEYTINHIHRSFTEKAHYTSVKFDSDESEFEFCGMNEEYVDGFTAPFVKESVVKIGMRHRDSVEISANDTILVVGEIEHVILPTNALDSHGYLDLAELGSVGIGGLNSYYEFHSRRDYPYARRNELPDFEP